MKKAFLLVAILAGTLKIYSQTTLDRMDHAGAAIEIGDYAKAIDLYSMAVEIDPQYAPAYFSRGIAKSKLKDSPGAIADFTKVIEIDPGDVSSYYNRGVEKGILKDFSGAIADFTSAITIDPRNASNYYQRGLARLEINQKESGCADLHKAAESGYTKATEAIKKSCK